MSAKLVFQQLNAIASIAAIPVQAHIERKGKKGTGTGRDKRVSRAAIVKSLKKDRKRDASLPSQMKYAKNMATIRAFSSKKADSLLARVMKK